jgi:hypothetical protein
MRRPIVLAMLLLIALPACVSWTRGDRFGARTAGGSKPMSYSQAGRFADSEPASFELPRLPSTAWVAGKMRAQSDLRPDPVHADPEWARWVVGAIVFTTALLGGNIGICASLYPNVGDCYGDLDSTNAPEPTTSPIPPVTAL